MKSSSRKREKASTTDENTSIPPEVPPQTVGPSPSSEHERHAKALPDNRDALTVLFQEASHFINSYQPICNVVATLSHDSVCHSAYCPDHRYQTYLELLRMLNEVRASSHMLMPFLEFQQSELQLVVPETFALESWKPPTQYSRALVLVLGPQISSIAVHVIEKIRDVHHRIFAKLSREEKGQNRIEPRYDQEDRDEWIYRLLCNGTPYDDILSALSQIKTWDQITTYQGLVKAANKYAEKHTLPEPPPRRRRK